MDLTGWCHMIVLIADHVVDWGCLEIREGGWACFLAVTGLQTVQPAVYLCVLQTTVEPVLLKTIDASFSETLHPFLVPL